MPSLQPALYQIALDRACGMYKLPEGVEIIACGNRATDKAMVHAMAAPLASRFVHLEVHIDAADWCSWGAGKRAPALTAPPTVTRHSNEGIAPEVLFFIQLRPEVLDTFDPKSKEYAFACPRTWEFLSDFLLTMRASEITLDPTIERAIYRGMVGERAAVEFFAFLRIWRSLQHPRAILANPQGAGIPGEASALIATCGSLYRLADASNFDAIVEYAKRLRPEVGEFLIQSCVKHNEDLQHTAGYISWAALNQA